MPDKTETFNTVDERFEQRLVELHEAVAAGYGPFAQSTGDETDPDLQQALEPAHHVLKLIERVRRREQAQARDDETVTFVGSSQHSALENSDPDTSPAGRLPDGRDQLPEKLGRFQVVRLLGQGGCGIVLLAHDPDLKRPVALKVPRPEALLTADVRSRFLREAEAAAALNHPHIVPVFEVGSDGPLSYIVSAYCAGTSLAEWLKQDPQPLEPRIAAELTATLADAVQHAHSRGIVHRDLKPANVLLEGGKPSESLESPADADTVTIVGRSDFQSDQARHGRDSHRIDETDGMKVRPTSNGQPLAPGDLSRSARISDFGLARIEGEDGQTQTGAILGTPSYMSPEQAEGDIRHVGPAADVYSLGAILYELLTGRPPFREGSILETLQAVRQKEPAAPRRLRAEIARDLEAICLKCLEKSPERRYASAAELAEDLRRHLRSMPVVARSVGSFERGVKWVRRHAVVSALLAVVAVSLVGGTTVSTMLYFRERDRAATEAEAKGVAQVRLKEANAARQAESTAKELAQQREHEANDARDAEAAERLKAVQSREEALWHLYVARLFAQQTAWEEREFGHLERQLAESVPAGELPDFRGWEWSYFQDQCRQASLQLATSAPPSNSQNNISRRSIAWSPTSGRMAILLSDGRIEILDSMGASEGLLPQPFNGHAKLQWHPDGERLIVLVGAHFEVWNVQTREKVHEFGRAALSANNPYNAVGWSPETDRVAFVTGKHTVVVQDANNGETLNTIKIPHMIYALHWHPDGVRLAIGTRYAQCFIANAQTGESTLLSHPGHQGSALRVLSWSPDGTILAVSSEDGTYFVDDQHQIIAGCEGLWRYQAHALTWSGRQLLMGCANHTLMIWDADAKQVTRAIRVHDQPVYSAAWGPHGKRILSSAQDVRITNLERFDEPTLNISVDKDNLRKIAWSPDGSRIAVSAGPDESTAVLICDADSGEIIHQLKHAPNWGIWSLAWSPDGYSIVSLPYNDKTRLWDAKSGELLKELDVPFSEQGQNSDMAWSPEGDLVAIANYGEDLSFYDAKTWKRKLTIRHRPMTRCLKWNSNGRYLAANNWLTRFVFDVQDRRLLYHHSMPLNERLDWSPDDRLLVFSSRTGEIAFVRARDGKLVHRAAGHAGICTDVDWAPDGHRIASCGEDGIIRIWDAATATELIRLPCGERPVSLAWSPDGRRLACGFREGIVRIWGSPEMESLPEQVAHLATGVLVDVPPFDQQPENEEVPPFHRDTWFASKAQEHLDFVEQTLESSQDEALIAELLESLTKDEELLTDLTNRRPQDVRLSIVMANHLASLKRWEEAEQQIERTQSLTGEDPRLDIARGDLYALREMWQGAVESYNRAISQGAESAPVFAKRAATQVKLEQFDSAFADYSRACELDPQNDDYPAKLAGLPAEVNQLGVERHRSNDFPKAVEYYRKAAELYGKVRRRVPDDRQLQLNLASVHIAIGILLPHTGATIEERIEVVEAARSLLEPLVDAEPTHATYRYELGRAAHMLSPLYWASDPEKAESLYRQAIDAFTQALSLFPEDANTLATRPLLRYTYWGLMQFLARGNRTPERTAQAIDAGLKALALEDDRSQSPKLEPSLGHRDRLETLLREAGRTEEADAVKRRNDELR